MNRVSKISTYGLILYLALMICCVQNTYLHHAMHQIMPNSDHNQIVSSPDKTQINVSTSHQVQSENTLFKSVFSLNVLAGLLVVFLLLFRNIAFSINAILTYIKRRKFKRRWRNLLLTSSFGLRSPPIY